MDISNKDWADVLVQALPYFKQYTGKTVVVKYGGNAMLNEDLKAAVMQDIVLLNTIGVHVVLVHGGGPEINALLEKIGKEPKFLPEVAKDNQRLDEILTSRRNDEISKEVNSKIVAGMEERLTKHMKDEDIVKYEEKVEERKRRNEFVSQYRNVLQNPNLDARESVDKEIEDKAKEGNKEKMNDSYLKTKDMIDKKIRDAKASRDDDDGAR